MIDESGFAKYSRIFSGNQYEGKTLATMIEGLETSRPDVAGDRTVILDAGIANAENLAYLRQRNWHYIVVNRGNASCIPEDLKDLKVLRQDPCGEIQLEVKRRQEAHETFLLCRSKGRREKDKAIRSRQEKSFLERPFVRCYRPTSDLLWSFRKAPHVGLNRDFYGSPVSPRWSTKSFIGGLESNRCPYPESS